MGRNKDKENLLSLLSNSNSLPQQLFKIQATVPQTTAIVVDPGNDTVPSNIPLIKKQSMLLNQKRDKQI